METWKVFFALPINPEKRQEISQALRSAKLILPGRVVPSSSWHITVYYIGFIEESKIEELVQKVSIEIWPKNFDLQIDHLGAFPTPQFASVLWCGFSDGEEFLSDLATQISLLMQKLKMNSDLRTFHGHLTLTRFARRQDVTKLINIKIPPVKLTIDRFVLYRSRIIDETSCYEELASFNLINLNN